MPTPTLDWMAILCDVHVPRLVLDAELPATVSGRLVRSYRTHRSWASIWSGIDERFFAR